MIDAEQTVVDISPLEKAKGRLRERLASEQQTAGARLRGERVLAESLGVSVRATAAALDEMTTEGLVTRERGRGTFLTAKGAAWAGTDESTGTATIALGLLLHDRIGLSSEILSCVSRAGASQTVLPMVSYTGWNQDEELAALRMMEQHATAVVALVPNPTESALNGFYATLPGRFPMHFVSLIREISPRIDAITFDYRAAAREAARQALAQGAQDVLFCGMDDGLLARQCQAGIEEARGERGGPFVFGLARQAGPAAVANELCARVRNARGPVAIVAKNEREAMAAASRLQAHGFRIPEDVSFTAFQFCPGRYLPDFPLTLLTPPCDALADLLLKRVEDCAQGRALDPMHVKLMLRAEKQEACNVVESLAGDEGL